ncbi:hypothetical protein [Pseudomonas indica]|uniref:Uncharacterized protein n=1 Tax=Pseudomonas indica TaxID=137658 RepID=A0A1G9J6Z9_9PSED|nr:hypothetical protein [Pseudomonas indica]PAU60060.1 hypothetical protein BZL42_10830 [Pseudomonas indica]SDL32983.1 hypothetical protein SAMN05216186_11868 [Pseudomonas indica]
MKDTTNHVLTWSDLLEGDGYLSPSQRDAFERAIGLVLRCLDDTLDIPVEPQYGAFHFGTFVDDLEPRFLHRPAQDELSGDAALTAYWVVRHIADGLLRGRGRLH